MCRCKCVRCDTGNHCQVQALGCHYEVECPGPYCELCGDCIRHFGEDKCYYSKDGKHHNVAPDPGSINV